MEILKEKETLRSTQSSTVLDVYDLVFDLPLRGNEIAAFRGAIAEKAGLQNEWFHNHDNKREGFHYRYPLIQYAARDGHAAITGIGDGAAALESFIREYDGQFSMKGSTRKAPVAEHRYHTVPLGTTEDWHTYRLRDWIALNNKHFAEWRTLTDLRERFALLEQAFVSHIMAFARGVGWQVERRLAAVITDYEGSRWVNCRGAELMAFDATFRVQALLPEGIGLGKAVSLGFGRSSQVQPD